MVPARIDKLREQLGKGDQLQGRSGGLMTFVSATGKDHQKADNKKGETRRFRLFSCYISDLWSLINYLILDSLNVFSLWAFLALSNGEANFLAFSQGFET